MWEILQTEKNVKDILHLGNDFKVSVYFGLEKTLDRLKNYHWKYKARDVINY